MPHTPSSIFQSATAHSSYRVSSLHFNPYVTLKASETTLRTSLDPLFSYLSTYRLLPKDQSAQSLLSQIVQPHRGLAYPILKDLLLTHNGISWAEQIDHLRFPEALAGHQILLNLYHMGTLAQPFLAPYSFFHHLPLNTPPSYLFTLLQKAIFLCPSFESHLPPLQHSRLRHQLALALLFLPPNTTTSLNRTVLTLLSFTPNQTLPLFWVSHGYLTPKKLYLSALPEIETHLKRLLPSIPPSFRSLFL